jgi:hypothetical protein
MGVNAANFVHQMRHTEDRTPVSLAVPILGFLICTFLWVNLSLPAIVVGVVWMVAGISYGAVRTRGFRAQLVMFDIPADLD